MLGGPECIDGAKGYSLLQELERARKTFLVYYKTFKKTTKFFFSSLFVSAIGSLFGSLMSYLIELF